ncbi:DUF2200 domain-containing protein [Anaerotignum lactatifermentans]|uniref:DUF2200 domain-containing protein n=1 Tax=Anaerotignum lactatifermentans TaxID=160404 RepID=A0ABS2GA66_9FIRM|nr:DUF2200 domain-containing protein [Anaerotignum lactatifermentans]MBM6829232.1 DUF2200 domain-containing protein [Anaerotignum lactatifermentans]MBM6877528.1 DUF2200 domain-containing protein [Anaerotignum lactatifermentans]MBM6950810.1 DUF2200 domain-containing protein [Anaerotignum lactatifermentans]
MKEEKVFGLMFSRVYPLLVAKAEKKGRTREEVDELTCWLTGYTKEELEMFLEQELTYGDFFRNAPAPAKNRENITGVICGVRVEQIEDPLMREIRRLDKLVDELAKGKPMEKILRQ